MCRATSEKEKVSHEDGDIVEHSLGLAKCSSYAVLMHPCQSILRRSTVETRMETDAQGLCSLSQGMGECRSEGIKARVARAWLVICIMLFLLPKGMWKLLGEDPEREDVT